MTSIWMIEVSYDKDTWNGPSVEEYIEADHGYFQTEALAAKKCHELNQGNRMAYEKYVQRTESQQSKLNASYRKAHARWEALHAAGFDDKEPQRVIETVLSYDDWAKRNRTNLMRFSPYEVKPG